MVFGPEDINRDFLAFALILANKTGRIYVRNLQFALDLGKLAGKWDIRILVVKAKRTPLRIHQFLDRRDQPCCQNRFASSVNGHILNDKKHLHFMRLN